MPGRPDTMRNGVSTRPPARLQNAPPDLYEYQNYEEEDEYEYKDCCCITGLLRDLDLIQRSNAILKFKKRITLQNHPRMNVDFVPAVPLRDTIGVYTPNKNRIEDHIVHEFTRCYSPSVINNTFNERLFGQLAGYKNCLE
ncbi:hypothetical protein TNIN_305121 [Trichonephila inaurata madagascariensis]|uniref:Uncharacterized protein n=1 Tax=Trichonephila inaurata madagascariensis TaxID=2747483 RepID=A0A8X6Y913_9ARAC|nr:hypothetical protein TNIN_305121 [Trichonephila inaurata madagascariensis]